ncbi:MULTISPECIES: SDR family NAD(P)-dependent oxidoreductase [Dietzia]|uniref:Oxidoreductase n=2 Tax=Dietzia TaxID=37914 RepID=A0ABN2ILN9_9ACTN|nr:MULTISPECIES: SDR family NAD(P)-dependent oxidoreductase [Dietzia]MBB1048692.1 SDR family NAD(P)-dependent oxidoreductase [Dietzia cercidiphylli]MBB1056728.1 SDR family NAD(P)-dependent oxidoreductase [Dietzia sp. B19]
MSEATWTVDALPDLTGTTVMVTGGTSGIGLEAARELAGRGAHVVLPSLTRAEGEAAASEIGGSTEVRQLDLGDLDAVRGFAASCTEPIDILLDNAGLMSKTRRETTDGFELHLGVNVLGPFLLTELLLPLLRERVVITASMAHAKGRIGFEDPHFRTRRYSMAAAYAQSKLACMLWGLDLQNRLTAAGSTVDVQLAHPGFAATSILDPTPFPPVNAVLKLLGRRIVPTAADGARPLLYAATEDLPAASYIGPTGFSQILGAPGPCDRSDRARDTDLARRLREFAVRETGAVLTV